MVFNSDSSTLLIIACSQRKRSTPNLLSAIDRYDGSSFRLIRRFLRQKTLPQIPPDLYILSAMFGLISSQEKIPNYDMVMTINRAENLQPIVVSKLQEIMSLKSYKKILICVGKNYLKALAGYELVISEEIIVEIARGAMGEKLSDLHRWLYGFPARSGQSHFTNIPTGKATLNGVEIRLKPEEVLEKARSAIAMGDSGQNHYKLWYLNIDGQQIAPKWLVSQITDLPVSSFTASDARRVLSQLGFKAEKIK